MTKPVLYSFRRCPYAIRARMALAKAGILWEHREVSLNNKPPEMLDLSDKGTVPVLVLADGSVIDESLDIMLWALDHDDPDRWLKADAEITLNLIYENDHEFKNYLDRYKYHVRYPAFPREHYRQQAESFLSILNEHLENNNGKGLLSSVPSLADVAIFPFVRQFAGVDRGWFDNSGYQYLVNWLAGWEAHEDFLGIMQKYEFWNSATETIMGGHHTSTIST